ncbi:DUF507 family protein [Helicobacter mustelae]|uniref:Competence/damage-inducible domain protein n=1 Tax=Helicobacter mustelae (strain ATCC 43772 / CCUG 25715 / CIP 103759 / LMG 18044 / NCTC 12198 / R85-136P) TaxID=679897 RepID=D3UIU6_HELM1|nr:DUF507 family protein [Helicobacter mustelae]CBG40421.1 Putative hypothetical protein [Helicobacter mustelae 12198]SQH71921.1 Protein of uncharacterised function (DUF507) [Helicobacter mustelae]STP13062.1 Protein of uncharacterised function (DUF507) [Helicobacter mustelae]
MKLKTTHVPYVANKIAIDIAGSNLLEVKTSLENIAKIAGEVLEEGIKKEMQIDAKAKQLIEENLENIEFMRADEKQLFWMIKRQIANDENFSLSWEDRYNELSHKLLDELILEGFIKVRVSENLVKNLIFKSIDLYAKVYEDVESAVFDKLKNYKRKLIVGTEEYELVFEKMYQEELKRRGF